MVHSMLNNGVAHFAQARKVRESVSARIVAAELSKRSNMVNVELAIQCRLGHTAPLTAVPVAVSGLATLHKPIWPVVFLVSAFPRPACWAARIARATLPIDATFDGAKTMFFTLARQAINWVAACITRDRLAFNVLRVVDAARGVPCSPMPLARGRAKRPRQLSYPTALPHQGGVALSAQPSNLFHASGIPASNRAITLFRVVPRRLKRNATGSARFWVIGSAGSVAARNRAEPWLTIRPVRNRLATHFADRHTDSLAQIGRSSEGHVSDE